MTIGAVHRSPEKIVKATPIWRGQRESTTERLRDKRPQCAARSGCCFHWLFEPSQQCALFLRNVCAEIKPLSGLETPHIVKLGHDAGR
ncbi:hypothetical protein GALL_244230 [mine drainage metagenome]|uniref:Uncharacterized protein n=1 Tax=mine drainage metagenome TaxID=410659 RepID=A0A1J5RNP5_9ZZZZ